MKWKVKTGTIIVTPAMNYRVVSIHNDIAELMELDTKYIAIRRLSVDRIAHYARDKKWVLIHDHATASDTKVKEYVDSMNKKTRKTLTVAKAVVKAYSGHYEMIGKRNTYGADPRIANWMKQAGFKSYPGFTAMIRKYLQHGFRTSALLSRPAYIDLAPAETDYSNRPDRDTPEEQILTHYGTEFMAPRKPRSSKGVLGMTAMQKGWMMEAMQKWVSGKVTCLSVAYHEMLEEHYTSRAKLASGKVVTVLCPVEDRPSPGRFYYFVGEHLTPEDKADVRESIAHQRRLIKTYIDENASIIAD